MNTKEFWQAYTGGITPAELMIQFQSRNPRRCAEHFAAKMPGMFGIMRKRTWKETFRAPVQHVREEIAHALTCYLEETRAEWEPIVEEYDRQAAETRRNTPPPEETPQTIQPPMESTQPIPASEENPQTIQPPTEFTEPIPASEENQEQT